MSKKKISPSSPWVFGKGKDIKQSMASGKNASVLNEFLSQMPNQASSSSYPGEIFQDALSTRNYNTAKPAQAVISDMLPVKYEAPNVYTKPSYPINQVIDDGLSVGAYNKPNFVMMGEQKLLPPPTATQATTNIMDDLVKPVAKKGVGLGTKLTAGLTAGLPGIGDIIFPEYANADETGLDLRNEMAKQEQHKIASDAELARMLGINAPDNFMMPVPPNTLLQQTPSRSVASIEPPQVVDEPQVAPSQPSISPSSNPAKAQMAYQQFSGGNKNTSYEDILRQQMAALNAQGADRSTMSYLDLSPLMQAVDNMTGSKMAQSYKGPRANAENDMAKVAGLAEKLADEAARKRQLDIQMQNALKNTADQRLQNAMQLAAYRASLANANGGLKPKDELNIKKMFSNDKRVIAIDTYNKFNEKLDAYMNELNKLGDDKFEFTGDQAARLEEKYNDLLVAYNKDEAELGALAGADINILQKVLQPVTGFAGAKNAAIGGGANTARQAIKDFQERTKKKAMGELDVIKATYPENIVNDQLGIYSQRVNAMSGGQSVKGRSPTTAVSNSVQNNDLESRVKAALERAKANKAQ